MYVGTRADNVAEACEIIGRELAKLHAEGVTEDELARAKEHVKGRMVLGLESTSAPDGRGSPAAILFDVPLLSLDEMLERVDAVDPDEVAELAAEFYDPGKLAAACVGPDEDCFRTAAGAGHREARRRGVIRVVVSGAAGRMGEAVCEAVEGAEDMELAGRADPALGTTLADALDDADVVVDFSTPETAIDNVARLRRRRRSRVVGTTGFDLERAARAGRARAARRTCSSPRTSRSAPC